MTQRHSCLLLSPIYRESSKSCIGWKAVWKCRKLDRQFRSPLSDIFSFKFCIILLICPIKLNGIKWKVLAKSKYCKTISETSISNPTPSEIITNTSMHSSRMRTACLLTVSEGEGVCPTWGGGASRGGLPNPWGSASRGVGQTPFPREQNDTHV